MTPQGIDGRVGATIRLWRAPDRVWPAFPTLLVIRAASRLGRRRDQRRSPASGEGGVCSVFLDGSNAGAILPKQLKVYHVAPGEHALSLHFLAGLRRSRKLHVRLAEGEERQFVCSLNALAWPCVRPATSEDAVAMERLHAAPDDGLAPA